MIVEGVVVNEPTPIVMVALAVPPLKVNGVYLAEVPMGNIVLEVGTLVVINEPELPVTM